MSLVTSAPVRTLAFGDLEHGPWGFVWGDPDAIAVIGGIGDERPIVVPVALHGDPESAAWSFAGDGIELTATAEHGGLCQVSGHVNETAVELLGLRTTLVPREPVGLDSLRLVLAWFGPDDGVSFSSARSRGAAGHERDEVDAAVFEPDGARSIDDGRLSTTYADGAPTRMSLELWLDEEEDSYPRRVAGEVLGSGAEAEVGGLALHVTALRSHRAGRDGLGVYVLARPR